MKSFRVLPHQESEKSSLWPSSDLGGIPRPSDDYSSTIDFYTTGLLIRRQKWSHRKSRIITNLSTKMAATRLPVNRQYSKPWQHLWQKWQHILTKPAKHTEIMISLCSCNFSLRMTLDLEYQDGAGVFKILLAEYIVWVIQYYSDQWVQRSNPYEAWRFEYRYLGTNCWFLPYHKLWWQISEELHLIL